MRQSRLWTVVAAVGALVLGFAPALAQEVPSKLRVGIQLTTSMDIVAKQRGWAEEMVGVPIEYVTFDSGRDAVLALGAGGVDMSLVGSAPTAFGTSSGLDTEVAWIFDLIGENEALVVNPDAGISTLADLGGKKLAVPFGSTTHYDMLQAIALGGLEADDVTLLDMDPNSMVAAYERGDIDGGWVWFPALGNLYAAGAVKVTDAAEMAEAGFPTSDLLVVNSSFGERYPDIVARYVAALDRAVKLYREDANAAGEDMVAEFGMELDDALTAMSQLGFLTAEEHLDARYMGTSDAVGGLAESLRSQAQFLKDQGIIEQAFDLDFYTERVNPLYIEMAIEKGYVQ